MQPKLEFLSRDQVQCILEDAQRLLLKIGIKVQSIQARQLLAEAGATTSLHEEIVHIPAKAIEVALKSAPAQFFLYDRLGNPEVNYEGDKVHFDPGSSGVHVLDPNTLEHHLARTEDLAAIVRVTEMLPQYSAQSTAVVCDDIPKAIGDLYRLYIVLLLSDKPIVTGSFSVKTLDIMLDMLAIFAGGKKPSSEKPRAVFDVCPTPPLIWSEFGAENLITLARSGIPAEMVSMPLAGVASPVTLMGSITQHAAESLAGLVIHQTAKPGAPIVWGGAPAIFDMRRGGTPFGAVETAMINAACAQVGKVLNLPTHGYLGASDSKLVDAQSGLESSMTTLVGALSGINMISGAGMLDFLACQSPEKLVLDAEAIASAQKLLESVNSYEGDLIESFYEGFIFTGEFLKQRITRDLFSREQHLPSEIIDRDSLRGWQAAGKKDTFQRAREKVKFLLGEYQAPTIDKKLVEEISSLVLNLAIKAGIPHLPELTR